MSNGWTPTSPCAPPTLYLPLSGGTMEGSLTLAADPVQPLDAATKQYIDAAPLSSTGRMGDNRIINGNFAVNQRSFVSGTALPASPTVANGYGHDRWKAGADGCTYTFTTALPDTTITITANTLTQIIEAGMIEGGAYTLSWTGTAQARVYQGTPTGAYAASPLITAALPAGANTIVEFNAGTLTRIKLEIGTVATPFNRQSLAKSMADCQRYYQSSALTCMNTNSASVSVITSAPFSVQMRAAPTLVITANGCVNIGSIALTIPSQVYWYTSGVVGSSGTYTQSLIVAASAEL